MWTLQLTEEFQICAVKLLSVAASVFCKNLKTTYGKISYGEGDEIMGRTEILFEDDFSSFPIGPLPFDREHSAMGEFHYCVNPGYSGRWYDPITNWAFRGPSWIVTHEDENHSMEQMRVRNPLTHDVCSTLVAGEKDWADYTLRVDIRALCTTDQAGILFRYQTSLHHYALFLCNQEMQLFKVDKTKRTMLASAPFEYTCDEFHTLSVSAAGDKISCSADGKEMISIHDKTYGHGCIALGAFVPVQYRRVCVECSDFQYKELLSRRDRYAKLLAEKRKNYAQPKLYKTFDLGNYGASRQIRFGHLTGTDELFFLIAQHQKRVYKERYCNISCLTAVSLESGKILWQWGEPSELEVNQDTTCDLPMQIYDINNDGFDEVIVARDFKLMILDGRTGKTLQWIDVPFNTEDPAKIQGIEFKKHAFDRLNVDAIRIVNVSGKERPSDILIKDRYARLYVYNDHLELIWKFCHNNTGHFPYAYDFNGDGRDEIFSCYNMISADGELLWELPIPDDHTDEIIIGRFNPDMDEDQIAVVAGWRGFMIVDIKGNILVRHINGHAQRISAANYCPDRAGLEICTTTYWENQGIIYLYDGKGREIWHMEPSTNGNIIAPVNWQGDGTELIMLNGNVKLGGMLDGDGDRVVVFPDDGHPEMCCEVLNITGDARDEIVLWDHKKMYIYTQDRPCGITDREYIPEKYPIYNSSNYRGEYSFARWRSLKPNGRDKKGD
ncbi:hypothetical protein [Treponema parvum]|uniref:hypothetical protein n=1 Tax=Treponema parvum TaxID=138851 RepID=UPI00211DB8F0|nr:hypothetical protein [Treponema parvum]